jgi:hypothetical protein
MRRTMGRWMLKQATLAVYRQDKSHQEALPGAPVVKQGRIVE